MARVKVQLEWPDDLGALPEGARARVTVEDTSQSDAASVVLAETELDLGAGTVPATELDVPEVDPSSDVIVRVHVSPAGRRAAGVEVGDLISTQSHPVLTRGFGDSVVVPLRRVGS